MAETNKAKPAEPDFERFMRKSKLERWAQRGLGKSATAVEGWTEMFSAFLYKLGVDVGSMELERWLDAYYQLRYEAEREADTAKFVAGGCKAEGRLEPIVPKAKPDKARSAKPLDAMAGMVLVGLLSGKPCMMGGDVPDADEKQEAMSKELEELLSRDEYVSLSPLGKMVARTIARDFDSETKEDNNG